MKIERFLATTLMAFLLVFATAAWAQDEPAPPLPPPHGPGMIVMHAGGMMMHDDVGDGRVITGAPMTVNMTMTHDNALADGNTIHMEHQSTVYRDSQGRVRREVQFELNTPSTGAVKHNMIIIIDPVSGKRYILNPQTKVAHEMPLRPRGMRAGGGGPDGEGPMMKSGGNVTTEQLGNKTILGLQATGTRVTRTIPAEQMGNAKPIEVVTERWMSNDLQIPLLTVHTDPMMGKMTHKVTSVNRAEPDASLFQIPSDYKVKSGRHGDMMYMTDQP